MAFKGDVFLSFQMIIGFSGSAQGFSSFEIPPQPAFMALTGFFTQVPFSNVRALGFTTSAHRNAWMRH